MTLKLLALHADLAADLERIAKRFQADARLTLVVRLEPYGPEAELVIGDDDLDEAIETIRRRQAHDRRPTVSGRPACPTCGGTGQVVVGPPLGNADGPQYSSCPDCGGTGRSRGQ